MTTRIKPLTDAEQVEIQKQIAADPDDAELTGEQLAQGKPFAEAFPDPAASIKRSQDRLGAPVEAGAKAFHDVMRQKRFLRWETSSEQYRQEIRELVRPAIVAALKVVERDGAAT